MLFVNAFFLSARALDAGRLLAKTFGAPNYERRLMMWGPLYAQLLDAQRIVPKTATLWWASPEFPWLVNYFLYPRTLRWGAARVEDAPALRRAHPADWVVAYREVEGSRFGRLELLAPLAP